MAIYDDFEQWPIHKIRQLQLGKLKETVEFAYAHSPFWRELYDGAGVCPADIRSLDDLVRFPTICKADLRRDLEENPIYGKMLAVPEDDIVYVASSSGTSGQPTISPFTQKEFAEIVALSRRFYAGHGMTCRDRHIHCLNLSLFVASPAVLSVQSLGAACLWGGVLPMERTTHLLKSLRITSVQITPSFAWRLGTYLKEQGIEPARDLCVERIIVAGEPGGSIPEVRSAIEKLWSAKVYEVYGFSEIMGSIASTCERQCGLHVAEDALIVEALDPTTGEPVPDGEKGELTFTALNKRCKPMIRYRSGDVGVIHREPCECGRTVARICVIGRRDDMFIVSGVNVYPSDIDGVVTSTRGITHNFRVRLRTHNYTTTYLLEVERVAGNNEPDADIAARVSDKLKKIVLVRPHEVTVLKHGEFGDNDSQKAKWVIDERGEQIW